MPAKHAPASPRSFYLSVARAAGGALGALALVVAIAVVAVNSRGEEPQPRGSAPLTTASPTTTWTSPTATAKPTVAESTPEAPRLRPRSKVTIQVLNATGRQGLAASVTSRLDDEGYAMKAPGNDEPTRRTTVYYRRAAEADARAFLDDHPEFGRIKEGTGDFDSDALLVIVLGSDYDRNN